MRGGRGRRRLLSPLTWRILAVNVAALLIPVAGLLYMGPYKDQMIAQEMEALRLHGEMFAGALGEGAVRVTADGRTVFDLALARHIMRRLTQPEQVRAVLFTRDGRLVADSRALFGPENTISRESLPPPGSGGDMLLRSLLALMDRISGMLHSSAHPAFRAEPGVDLRDMPEVARAAQGLAAGVIRQTADGQLVLSAALPVQHYYRVIGVLMLSASGAKIDAAMREVRVNILLVFAGGLVVTTLLSLYLAGAIARPVRKLAAAAERVRGSIGRNDETIPDFTARRDEIGDLSRSLRNMTDALRTRLDAIERFAADVTHEIKNPLTSLRSAVETAARIQDPARQRDLMHIIKEDVIRLDRLISDISDASRLDTELSRSVAEPVALERMLAALAEIHNATAGERNAAPVDLDCAGRPPFTIAGMEGRLAQVFRNLIANAVSFSPPGGRIALRLTRDRDWIRAVVEDQGPGIPEAKLEAVFDRFYSERPQGEKFGSHSGLGLAISRQIVEAHGGSIRAENRRAPDGAVEGARFILLFPVGDSAGWP